MAEDVQCEGRFINYSTSPVEPGISPFVKNDAFDILLTVTVFFFLTVAGLFGNFLFIFVRERLDPRLRVANTILANLAASDVVLIIHCYINCLYFFSFGPISLISTRLNSSYCITSALLRSAEFMSLFAITMVSLERYTAIYIPVKHGKIFTALRARSILACLWIVSILLSFLHIPANDTRRKYCLYFHNNHESSNLIVTVFYSCNDYSSRHRYEFGTVLGFIIFYPAFFLNVFCSLRMMQRLKNNRQHEDVAGIPVTTVIPESVYRSVEMIIICGVIYFSCTAPFLIYGTIHWLGTTAGENVTTYSKFGARILFQGANMFTLLNSATKPYIYAVVNPRYLSEYLEMLSFRSKVHTTRYNPANEADDSSQPITDTVEVMNTL